MEVTQAPPRVLGVYIRKYKNLHDTWLPWHDGIAIFGANGSGKTNLFEALSILFAAAPAIELLRPRISDVHAGDLEVVAQMPAAELPWPPDLTTRPIDPSASHEFPGLIRAQGDRMWWESIGASSGDTFLSGLASLGLPDSVTVYLEQQIAEPVIRYSLRAADYRDLRSGTLDTAEVMAATYDRTLLGTTPPTEVVALAAGLPDAFAPLRAALTAPGHGTPEGLVDIVTLPPTATPPATLQWLPTARSSKQADLDLVNAFRDALRSADHFAAQVAELGLARLPEHAGEADVPWWLHEVLTRKANDELARTMPGHIAIRPEGGGEADIDLIDLRDADRELGRAGDDNMLDALSAGERRWVDEALAAAARELNTFAGQTGLYAHLMGVIDEDLILPELLNITDTIQQLVNEDGYFGADALQLVFDALEPALRNAGREQLDTAADPLVRQILEDVLGLRILRPTSVIRLFDEPEAHLHPAAQRVIAAALESLRRAGDNIIIATHSPQFLDLPGWHLTHLQRTPEGAALSPLTTGDLDARKALAGQMGMTRGELLARLNYLLIVEGEHDRLVLETLFGTQLDEAGIGIARMHGTANLLATAELDFIGRYLDIPVAVLTDNTRIARVQSGQADSVLTDEERALRTLRRACNRRGAHIALFGLQRPDITAYLHPEAVTALNPTFPGWDQVLHAFARKDRRPSFKPWLFDHYGVDLRQTPQIRHILDEMQSRGLDPERELTHRVEDVVRAAVTGQWPGAAPGQVAPREG